MTVFKTFFKILNKNKFIVILYTVILVTFGGFNMQTSDNNVSFILNKPSITIVNNDENVGITKSLIKYIHKNSKTPKINLDEDSINDALFYGDSNYVIYIPKNYHIDYVNNPEIIIKSSNNYNGQFANMLLKKYIKTLNAYKDTIKDEDDLIKYIDKTLNSKIDISLTKHVNNNKLYKTVFYFNFASYSILACLIYVICVILSIFNDINIKKRIIISSTNYRKNNRILLLSNIIYALCLWLFYIIIAIILLGNIIFSLYGIIFIINLLLLTLCATTIAFFIGTIVTNKNVISGIVNVVALGSSFLCGAFVPMDYLPKSVINASHILPTYYYVKNNELLKNIDEINFNSLKPIIINMIIIIIFIVIFIIITNIVSRKKRKFG